MKTSLRLISISKNLILTIFTIIYKFLLFIVNTAITILILVLSYVNNAAHHTLTYLRKLKSFHNNLAGKKGKLFRNLTEPHNKLDKTETNTCYRISSSEFNNFTKSEKTPLILSGKSKSITTPEDYKTRLDDIMKLNERINNITRIIEKIAFNTNTLALNTAVEAARAGENGYGFAAISNELRILAKQATSALEDINYILNDSIQIMPEKLNEENLPEKNIDNIQTKMINLIDIFNELYDISANKFDKPEKVSMRLKNNSQQKSMADKNKNSPHDAFSSRKDNSSELDTFLKDKKPTFH